VSPADAHVHSGTPAQEMLRERASTPSATLRTEDVPCRCLGHVRPARLGLVPRGPRRRREGSEWAGRDPSFGVSFITEAGGLSPRRSPSVHLLQQVPEAD